MGPVDLLRALLTAAIALVVAWAACALAHWADGEVAHFPGDALCVIAVAGAVVWWLYANFGHVIRR